MIKKYRVISTIKRKPSDNPKAPTHSLVAKTSMDKEEKSEFVASLWAKTHTDSEGTTKNFLSGEMDKGFVDMDGQKQNRSGWVIVKEDELDYLIKRCQEMKAQLGEPVDDNYPTEKAGDVPF